MGLESVLRPALLALSAAVLVDCVLPDFEKVSSALSACSTNAECLDAALDEPHVCRAGRCIALKTKECPVVLEPVGLRQPDPILIGAYSAIDPLQPSSSPTTLSYQLAIEDIAQKVTGLPGAPGGKRRPLVAIVCNGQGAGVDASAARLIDTLGVPAVVSALYAADLRRVFEEKALAKKVFFLSPFEADDQLRLLRDEGLLWHMLSGAESVAQPYVPLLARAEAYLKPTEPLRVALLESRVAFLGNIAELLSTTLLFNGKKATDNDNKSFFLRRSIESELVDANADFSEVVTALAQFAPHVVVSITGGEFVTKVLPALERVLPAAAPKPFYLLSPHHVADPRLLKAVEPPSTLPARMAGVNFAAATDPTAYNTYLGRLISRFPRTPNLAGTENFYDSIYFLAYAMAAAGPGAKLDGPRIAENMPRLLGGQPINVGLTDIARGLETVSNGGSISLVGTLGPPDFDANSGVRRLPGSVYCVTPTQFQYDVLRYDASSMKLSGTFTCLPDF